jgi:hypothetical protein
MNRIFSRKCIFCERRIIKTNPDDFCNKCKYILHHNVGERKIYNSIFINGKRVVVP